MTEKYISIEKKIKLTFHANFKVAIQSSHVFYFDYCL